MNLIVPKGLGMSGLSPIGVQVDAGGGLDAPVVAAGPVGPFSGLVDVTDLVSYYKADEASGNLIDATESGLDMTQNGSPLRGTGKINTARDLVAASTQYFTRTAANYGAFGGDFTFTAWVKQNADVNNYFLSLGSPLTWMRNSGSGGNWQIVLFNDATDDGFSVNAVETPRTGWTFIAAYYNSVTGEAGISVDGGDFTTDTHAVLTRNPSGNLVIGARVGVASFDGLLDEMSIWKRVLTIEEVQTLYNGGAGLAY